MKCYFRLPLRGITALRKFRCLDLILGFDLQIPILVRNYSSIARNCFVIGVLDEYRRGNSRIG